MKRRDAIQGVLGSSLALIAGGGLQSCGPGDGSPKGTTRGMQGIGVATSGFGGQFVRGELTLQNLPEFLNGELGVQLMDVQTGWFPSLKQSYVEACREVAAASGCSYVSVKVNHISGDLYSEGGELASAAFAEASALVDVAHWLGAAWIRFAVPEKQTVAGDLPVHRNLADYAAERDVRLIIENDAWMRSRADSVTMAMDAIGRSQGTGPESEDGSYLAAGVPDTGNWDDAIREPGLRNSLPHAVSCDLKIFSIDGEGAHSRYDLRRCFDIADEVGFRGLWMLEHRNEDTSSLVHNLLLMRDQLRAWMREVSTANA